MPSLSDTAGTAVLFFFFNPTEGVGDSGMRTVTSRFLVTERIIYILIRDFLVRGTELKFMCSVHQNLVNF